MFFFLSLSLSLSLQQDGSKRWRNAFFFFFEFRLPKLWWGRVMQASIILTWMLCSVQQDGRLRGGGGGGGEGGRKRHAFANTGCPKKKPDNAFGIFTTKDCSNVRFFFLGCLSKDPFASFGQRYLRIFFSGAYCMCVRLHVVLCGGWHAHKSGTDVRRRGERKEGKESTHKCVARA